MNFYLIRHGQTDWNVAGRNQGQQDTELNEEGLHQANALGITLRDGDYNIKSIYSSKQKRAYKTAEIVSQYLNVDCRVLEGLEEVNLGAWEGISWREVKEKYPEEFKVWYENRRYTKAPGGESYDDMLMRALKAITFLAKEVKEDVAIVTHSAVIMVLQCYLNHTPFEEMLKYKTENTSIVQIDSSKFI